jgi:UDP-N-acetylmuramyl pentapeptide phosphotransferase/UDP-N-acetylglucosamine-1-phosphate transferase
MSLALAGAALAFLAFNLRGKIFMGDGGSIPLGFLAASLGLTGWQAGAWPIWFPAMVFAPFIVDAGVTLARRIARGEKFWEAHREHYYQRAVQMGLSHTRLAACEYALMLVCAGAALGARNLDTPGRAAVFATIGVALFALMLAIDARWKRFNARN